MKKATVLCLVFTALMTNSNVMAQDSQFRGSAGLALGTKSNFDTNTGNGKLGFGLNLGLEYLFNEQFSIAPSYTLFFPNDPFGLSAINIDGRYYFSMDDTEIYGLLGYARLTTKIDLGFGSLSDSAGGVNFGVGANFGLNDKLKLNTQLKYTTAGDSSDGQLVINGGIVIGF